MMQKNWDSREGSLGLDLLSKLVIQVIWGYVGKVRSSLRRVKSIWNSCLEQFNRKSRGTKRLLWQQNDLWIWKQTCLDNALGTDWFPPEKSLQVSADYSACWNIYLNVDVRWKSLARQLMAGVTISMHFSILREWNFPPTVNCENPNYPLGDWPSRFQKLAPLQKKEIAHARTHSYTPWTKWIHLHFLIQ